MPQTLMMRCENCCLDAESVKMLVQQMGEKKDKVAVPKSAALGASRATPKKKAADNHIGKEHRAGGSGADTDIVFNHAGDHLRFLVECEMEEKRYRGIPMAAKVSINSSHAKILVVE